jgi:hypothetical protein
MQEFEVNKFITLRLEKNDTVIYILRKRFRQCKYLLLNIPILKIATFDEIESIDEIQEGLNHSLEPVSSLHGEIQRVNKIPPEVEFLGHCSNLQVWYENSYNTRLMDKNLAFPLLKKLTEVGDLLAKKVFKEEIVKRFESGYVPVIKYLLNEGYLDYLSDYELCLVIDNMGDKIYNIIETLITDDIMSIINNNSSMIELSILERLYSNHKNLLKKIFRENLKNKNPYNLFYLAYMNYLDIFDKRELIMFLNNGDFELIEKVKEMIIQFDSTGGFLEHIKSIDINKFKRVIDCLYKTEEPKIFYFLDREGYNDLISREKYYRYLLTPNEAKTMINLEKMLNLKFYLAYGAETNSENEIVCMENHIIELAINSNSKTSPDQILDLKSLRNLYLYMPNLTISNHTFKKLKTLEKFEFEFKNILNKQKEKK